MCEVVALWKQNEGLPEDEFFHKASENLKVFKEQWGHGGVLVKITEHE